MTRPVPVHYLRANEREYTPAACIFLDTETWTDDSGPEQVERLRLWVATYTDRRATKGRQLRNVTAWGATAWQLAEWVDQVTKGRGSVWLYAHNLAFDLTTTRLPLELGHRGWRISDASIGGQAPWLRMAKSDRALAITDSWGWLPVALDQVAVAVGRDKPPLPAQDDDQTAWLARCGADVDILGRAVLGLMDWWDDQRLGNWSISGAATGWNAYRHTPTTSKVVIDPDPAKVARDRLYVHGGRRGVWRIGEHRAGPFLELDLTAAYPTTAAECPLPRGRAWTFTDLPLDHPNLSSDRWGVTATCRIRSDLARWPVRANDATWYPVGDFWADLAGPDIREAIELGALVAIGQGEVHQLGRNMRPWARW